MGIFATLDAVGIAPTTPEVPTVTWAQVAYALVILLLVPIGNQLVLHLLNNRKLDAVKDSTAKHNKQLDAKLETVKEATDEVVHEVKPNSGSSMADKINETAKAVTELAPIVSDVANKLNQHLDEAKPLNDYVRKQMEREEYDRDRPRLWGKRHRRY